MKTQRISFVGLCFATFAAACGSPTGGNTPGTAGSGGPAGAAGTGNTTGAAGTGNTTGAAGTGNTTGAAGTGNTTGAAGTGAAGTGNTTGTAGSGSAGTTGAAGTGVATGGRGGATGGAGTTGSGGRGGTGAGGGAGGGTPSSLVVTSASGNYWKTGTLTETTSNATVTVNDASVGQKWEGFGGSFNEMGWSALTSPAMQTQALNLLFSADGANFTWGRIPMGASDYALVRYTNDDTGTDVAANSSGSNRPPADTSTSMFSIARDGMYLIPYIKAAQAVKPGIRFWASPWTPPVWMKTGYKTDNGSGGTAVKPSYFDGGNMVTGNTANLTAYAQIFTKFVNAYKGMGINIEVVSPQNEPGYDQNYPSCLWDSATYVSFIKSYLGPAMMSIGVKVMLGTMSNAGDGGRNDINIATAVLADSTAKSFLSVAGAQWGVLEKVNGGQTFGGLPIWATEHKCGNYPWNPATGCGEASSPCPAYNMSMAPNDHAYGVESWIYLRNAITKGKVTAYNAWNMVLNRYGLGNDMSRHWGQNALLVADGGSVTATPTYYVFRHLAQYVVPDAMVVGTSGGDAVAFKNPDGSIVVAAYNSGAANSNYVVAIGGKKYQFAMPGNGWATVRYKP